MRFLLLFALLSTPALWSCNGCSTTENNASEDSKRTAPLDSISTIAQGDTAEINDAQCDSLLLVLIRSSNFKPLTDFKDQIFFQIDNASLNIITLRAYTISDVNMRMTLGWIVVDLDKPALMDVTNDPDQPVELNYDIQAFSNFENCWSLIEHDQYNVPDEDD